MWISNQINNYKKKEQIMNNKIIYNKFTEFINDDKYNKFTEFINDDKYKKYIVSNENEWQNNLNKVKQYIDENDKRPSSSDKNDNIKTLGLWILHQVNNYIKKEQIMKNEEIYNKFTNIINDDKYKKYFLSNEDEWLNNLNKVKQYIDKNDKKPSSTDKNDNIKTLGRWILTQINNYTKKKYIMKNDKNIYNEWGKFINYDRYKKYFI